MTARRPLSGAAPKAPAPTETNGHRGEGIEIGSRPRSASSSRSSETRSSGSSGEGAARDARRPPALIAAGDAERRRRRTRAAPVVGALPRQAEGRDVHAAGQARGRTPDPQQLRAIGDSRIDLGRARRADHASERPAALPRAGARCRGVLEQLHAAGLTTLGACGDTVRAITGCPVVGMAATSSSTVTPVLDEATVSSPEPGLLRSAAEAQDLDLRLRLACNAPEINCISLLGTLRDGEPGFGVLVGGGLASVPRIARDLASSSGRTRRSPCFARSSTPGATTSAGACRASSRA